MRLGDAFLAVAAWKKEEEKKTEELSLRTAWSEEVMETYSGACHPRPQFARNSWFSLDGYWSCAFTKSTRKPEYFGEKILVPFSPECARSGVGRQLMPGEYLWYYRTVEIPARPKKKRLLLHFGAVDERCTVWWNGRKVGSHENGYLSFSFDVTEHLREGANSLWVRVQDDSDQGTACRGKQSLHPAGMFYTAQSGIWQSVWMEWVPENEIRKLTVTPDFDEEEVTLEITMRRPEDITILIQGEQTSYYHSVRKEAFEKQGPECASVLSTVTVPEFHPWSPEDPFLYGLEITSGEDCVKSYFAMRKFSTGTDEAGCPRLMLNNEPYFFNGVLDQGYWPESLYTPPCDEAMEADILGMKKLGFNTIRKHVKIEPMRWYYHCDRLGMVVWQDMVNGGGKLDLKRLCYLPNLFPAVRDKIRDSHYRFFAMQDRRTRLRWEADCLRTVKQLYNCPCIGMWVPFNEGWGQFDACRIEREIKREDPTRLVDHASGWYDQGGGDIKSVHNYFRKNRVKRERRPVVLTEYGGYGCAIKGHSQASGTFGYHVFQDTDSLTGAFRKLQREIAGLEKQGLSGAVYTQLSDVESEVNGLYTYDRKICKIK